MIVVGEGEDQEPPDDFLRKSVRDTVLNLLGDYRYLSKGYYVSLHAEENGCVVYPSVKNALDVYRAPVFVERLKKAGIDSPELCVLRSPNPQNCVLVPLNPFSRNSAKLITTESQYNRYFKSLSMDYHYPVVQVRVEGEVEEFEFYMGRTRKLGNGVFKKIYDLFGVPLGKILAERIGNRIRPFYFMPMMKNEIDFDFLNEVLNENCMLCRKL
ncbi:MAG: RimK-like ATPgrasp N-terminal domain-containing protein [Archaeoglobales archaeon]|nr:RimK-like ATPgrasp N-terminal domain-containing protein [Archaeoglobales archaeon]MDI9642979.1 RimK-like ATPgrasp N-terminal domain-containing protein [Archaeoglobales archaeon]